MKNAVRNRRHPRGQTDRGRLRQAQGVRCRQETSAGGLGIDDFSIDIAPASQMDQWRAQIAAWIVKLVGA